MGGIAASGRPDVLAMFRDILIASASVPGAYQPVLLNAQGRNKGEGGVGFKEMHVDGATSAEVFVAPALISAGVKHAGATPRKAHLWVLINNTLSPEYGVTEIGALSIAGRSLATLTKAQTIWIIKAAQQEALSTSLDFNIAQIDRHVAYDAKHPFGLEYMRTIYETGYERATSHTLWGKGLAPFTRSALKMPAILQ